MHLPQALIGFKPKVFPRTTPPVAAAPAAASVLPTQAHLLRALIALMKASPAVATAAAAAAASAVLEHGYFHIQITSACIAALPQAPLTSKLYSHIHNCTDSVCCYATVNSPARYGVGLHTLDRHLLLALVVLCKQHNAKLAPPQLLNLHQIHKQTGRTYMCIFMRCVVATRFTLRSCCHVQAAQCQTCLALAPQPACSIAK
jgi:hypothetical protein